MMWTERSTSLCLMLCWCFISHSNAAVGSSCKTPNGESSKCRAIHNCKILLDAVKTTDNNQIRFLRESQCRNNGPDILVCCGSDNNYRQTTRSNNLIPDRTNCGFQTTQKIFGGVETELEEFPWMALIYYKTNSGEKHGCGGSLISKRYVLSAAHCVKGDVLRKLGTPSTVVLGEHDTRTGKDCVDIDGYETCNDEPLRMGIDYSVVHPDYDEFNANRYNDIALIRLKNEVSFTDFVRPICLPEDGEESEVGRDLFVAGWGKTEYGVSSPVKLKVAVPISQKNRCSARFRTAGVRISESQICSGGEHNKDSCTGDSGGPLMATSKSDNSQWYVEGVVSFGTKCGTKGWPGIYTKVETYRTWIVNNIRP